MPLVRMSNYCTYAKTSITQQRQKFGITREKYLPKLGGSRMRRSGHESWGRGRRVLDIYVQ